MSKLTKLTPEQLHAAILATVPTWTEPMDTDMVIGRLRDAGTIGLSNLRFWKRTFLTLEALETEGHVHHIEGARGKAKRGGAPARGRWYMRGPAQSEAAS